MRLSRVQGPKRTPIASRCWAVTEAAVFSRCNRSARSPRRSSTWWRTPLADEWRRYLEQQIELGGAEVLLSAGQRDSGTGTEEVSLGGSRETETRASGAQADPLT